MADRESHLGETLERCQIVSLPAEYTDYPVTRYAVTCYAGWFLCALLCYVYVLVSSIATGELFHDMKS